MPLQATSGAASYDAFGGGVPFVPTYIEEIFQTWLYTGNGGTSRIRIQNGVDVLNKGGLVWIKNRGTAQDHYLTDTARGMFGVGGNTSGTFRLSSNNTAAQIQDGPSASVGNSDAFPTPAVPTDGFFINAGANANSAFNYVSWTFREQPKFFDVVTWTGNDVNGRVINHNLGSVPGVVIIKSTTSGTTNWIVHHRSLGTSSHLLLNTTGAAVGSSTLIQATTSTSFTVSGNSSVNGFSETYVAYLFAHNAGGFGLSGTDNVISCGSYTGNGSATGPVIDFGYEPQWVLIKRATGGTGNWGLIDNMRGFTVRGIDDAELNPNLSAAEGTGNLVSPTATGFDITTAVANYNASGSTYIYIAIRRGPMRVPTTGTSVFSPIAVNASAGTQQTTSFPVDLQLFKTRTNTDSTYAVDRLRGVSTTPTESAVTRRLETNATNAEQDSSSLARNWNSTGFAISSSFGSQNQIYWNFRRAPGYMDVCCYTGTGSARTVAHNLAAVPELMIVKRRTGDPGNWAVYHIGADLSTPQDKYLYLNSTDAVADATVWNDTAPTASQFTVGGFEFVNASGANFVAYLFATCPGVSKVGSYTGTGATQVINCGFTGGARFVLIKATSTTGDWYVWDSARGIVSGNDPYLRLNSTAAEVTNTDWVDTAASGFELSNAGGNLANSNGVSYVFLAIS